jgi:inositol-phosphate phosphatase / L-galactose 1-phosphate phosphatase / histidinol-phosphatase
MVQVSERAVDEWLAFAHELADTAHAMLAPAGRVRPDVEVKTDRSFVTAFDLEIEQRLREIITKRYPSHGILGEEGEPSAIDAELVWVLDPIDGTAPFIAGVPVYGTLISLTLDGAPVVGVIDMASTPDRWIGARGRQTRHTNGPCRTRACASLAQAILTSSNPDFFPEADVPVLDALRKVTAWRIFGSACMAYGLMASGRTDVAVDTGFKVHDFAPFVPIIEGAGGRITDWQGQPLTLTSGPTVLAACQPDRHAEALAIVQRALTK